MARILIGLALLVVGAVAFASGTPGGNVPDEAFGIEGSELLYSELEELRWRTAEDGRLHLQTTQDVYWDVEVLSDNVVRLSHPRQRRDFFLFRIGSPEYKRMQEYRECVTANRGRKLFEVEDCGELPAGVE